MEFQEKTIRIIIDETKCRDCSSKACIASCKTYARGILVLTDDGIPSIRGDAMRLGTECLACEYECRIRGNGAITIEAPTPGLEEYRLKMEIS